MVYVTEISEFYQMELRDTEARVYVWYAATETTLSAIREIHCTVELRILIAAFSNALKIV